MKILIIEILTLYPKLYIIYVIYVSSFVSFQSQQKRTTSFLMLYPKYLIYVVIKKQKAL